MKTGPLTVVLLAGLASGCPVQTSVADDAGAVAASAAGQDAATISTATGGGCDAQTATGVPLCQTTSLCPTVTVNLGEYQSCGFRIRGNVIDLECECNGYLCPIGTATDCSDAASLLALQNSGEVCSHVPDGSCLLEVASASDAGTTTTTTTTGTSSSCDTACESTCVGDPNCIQACGC